MTVRARDALAQVPLFAGMPPRFLKRLGDKMDEQRFMEGATIVRQGEPGDTFYVLVEGEAKVKDANGRTLSRLIPGDFFGEISLMDGGPRTATVVAETNLTTLALSRKDFSALLQSEPKVTVGLLKHASALLRRLERPAAG
ncbi:MAG TPA: cyclic nucleotide-binding domain-containing protein [Actinomycetota bacterium]|nr:cyclic nucleotide-binding domain-containing protein [Actinomycetota bacterium]